MSADRIRANIKARLSLRDPQADSLDILANVLERIPFSREPWPGELLFSIGRCMHSTGFCVECPVSDFIGLSIAQTVVCLRSPAQCPVFPVLTAYQQGSCWK